MRMYTYVIQQIYDQMYVQRKKIKFAITEEQYKQTWNIEKVHKLSALKAYQIEIIHNYKFDKHYLNFFFTFYRWFIYFSLA